MSDHAGSNHSAHEHAHASHGGAHESHGGVRLYVSVALALLVLTFMSYLTYTPVWPFGESVAIKRLWMMAVSCTKAMLVIMFFMHLKWEANWKWVLTIPASLMSVFLVLMLVPDVAMRMRKASPERLKYAAEVPVTAPAEGNGPMPATAERGASHNDAAH